MIPPPSEDLPQWLEYIHARTDGMAEDAACLSKGEVRYLLECYLGYERAFQQGVANLDIPYAEPGTPLAHAAIANTLLKVELVALRERSTEKEETNKPALQVQYDICQQQLRHLEKDKEELLHTTRFHRDEIARLNGAIEDRDRALASQIEAYDHSRDEVKRLREYGERLEKKLARLTSLAEDLVDEAASK